jgi:hypothetical protein
MVLPSGREAERHEGNVQLCFARIKSGFEMTNIQRGGVTLLRPLWRAKLQFAGTR